MNFYVNQYGEEIKKYDKNNDNKVYKLIVSSNLKTDNSGKFLDNTGNVLPLFLDNDGSRWPEGAGYSLINVSDNAITEAQLETMLMNLLTTAKTFSQVDPNGFARLDSALNDLLGYAFELILYIWGCMMTGKPIKHLLNF